MPGLRESLDLIRMVRPEAGTSAIEHEIMAERASSLGAAEARVKKAMAALSSADSTDADLAEARDAVWGYFVQREMMGLRQHGDIIREFSIPPSVLNGLGAMPAKRK